MKKIIISAAVILSASFGVFAQENETKQKKDYSYLLPQAGDFALVIDAGPFLKYTADLLSFDGGVSATAPDFKSFRQDVMGKYFLNSHTAVRARLTIDVDNANNNYYVLDDNKFYLDGDVEAQVVDHWKKRKTDIEIGGGLEKRIGFTRIQGYVAGELFLGFGKETNQYIYGNPISEANSVPSTTIPGMAGLAKRPLYNKTAGNNFIYGLRGIVGIDYFITKNIAIGGEIALEARGQKNTKTLQATEEWEVNQITVKEELNSPGGSTFKIDATPVTSLSISFFF
ncbi:MAG: hypothetical protein LBS07_04650 [Prevotellaceae bacterium]|jgi:hypothetical protein|nr:hypothetical protein [Prevotellaceae bacterium]